MTALALAVLVAAAAPSPVRDQVRAWRTAHELAVLRELATLLAIPNVASDTVNIRRNGDHLVALLQRRGFAARLLDGAGGPSPVYGERRVPGARRTLLFYMHYDGQPVDETQWQGSPWMAVLRDKALEDGGREIAIAAPFSPEARLYARSASDDKGPIVALLAALDALDAAKTPLSVNVKVLLEGEEEAGSPHVEPVLQAHKDLLQADAWVLCDGPVHQTRRPQVFFGARGTTDLEITLYGASRALHSGHYGNWAPNPAVELAHLLAALRDRDGRILVPGFYDDVRAPTASERAALAEVPDVDADLRRALALGATEANGARLVERLMLPALNVRGVFAGRVGTGAANAIPTEARTSVDFRLVPEQTPPKLREQVEAHLRGLGYTVVHDEPGPDFRRAHPRVVRLEWGPGYPAARTAMDLPAARAIVAAVEEVTGPLIRLPTLGGSVPMRVFADVTGRPIVGVPIVNHDNNQHAANENLRLQNLWDGIEVFAALVARAGALWPD